jgi:phage shock protein C
MNSKSGTKVLVRKRDGRMVAGVCAGLAAYFGSDVTLIRVIVVALAIVTGGAGIPSFPKRTRMPRLTRARPPRLATPRCADQRGHLWPLAPAASSEVAGGRRSRNRGIDPMLVARCALAVGAQFSEHGLDEPDEFGMLLGDRQPLRLRRETWPDDLGVWILSLKPGEDRVVGGDRSDVTLLKQDEAVRPALTASAFRHQPWSLPPP